jgi:hypothetical protein
VNSQLSPIEREWISLVKSVPCVVTGASPPSQAHHTKQGNHFTTIALSQEAHQGRDGEHGTKELWRLYGMTEQDALNATIRAVFLKIRSRK